MQVPENERSNLEYMLVSAGDVLSRVGWSSAPPVMDARPRSRCEMALLGVPPSALSLFAHSRSGVSMSETVPRHGTSFCSCGGVWSAAFFLISCGVGGVEEVQRAKVWA